jgi:hypothetical protein
MYRSLSAADGMNSHTWDPPGGALALHHPQVTKRFNKFPQVLAGCVVADLVAIQEEDNALA